MQHNTDLQLPKINQLIQNGQPQFGVFAHVTQLNYLDYHSHLISQKPVAIWHKALKANQFAFIQIVHAPYRICIAVATIKLASSAFAYTYNDETDQLEVIDAIRPLSYQSTFNGDHQHGLIKFSHATLSVEMRFKSNQINLNLDSKLFKIQTVLNRNCAPLALCTPSGRRGWTFTQKEPFDSVVGTFKIKPTSKHYNNEVNDKKLDNSSLAIAFKQSTKANLDWTLGYMRHVTNWFWACINTTLADKREFMLNLSMGVNETGVSENACWLDNNIHYLPPVLFKRNEGVKNGVWTINHQHLGWSHVTVDLTFTPIRVYKKSDNYGVIASIFEQWIGKYSGVIELLDSNAQVHVIRLDGVPGLAEDHFAKW